jgi:hypothetical protein
MKKQIDKNNQLNYLNINNNSLIKKVCLSDKTKKK